MNVNYYNFVVGLNFEGQERKRFTPNYPDSTDTGTSYH